MESSASGVVARTEELTAFCACTTPVPARRLLYPTLSAGLAVFMIAALI